MVLIKYPEGKIEINPEEFFKTGTVRAFRKLVKMSAASDLTYDTEAVREWNTVLDRALMSLRLLHLSKTALRRKKERLEKFKSILEGLK